MNIIIGKSYVLFSWFIFSTLLITKPVVAYNSDGGFVYIDKLAHVIIFGILASLIISLIMSLTRYLNIEISYGGVYGVAAFFCLVFISLGELVQLFIMGREGSFFDVFFGVLGVISAIYLNKTSSFNLNFVCYNEENNNDKH